MLRDINEHTLPTQTLLKEEWMNEFRQTYTMKK